MAVLNSTAVTIEDLVMGQSSLRVIDQAKEVQFHVVIVCAFVCMFCVYFKNANTDISKTTVISVN